MQVRLGISPGSRHIGIAVLYNRELITWRVHTFRGKWSDAKRKAMLATLEKLFASYDIKAVAVKVPDKLPDSFSFGQVLGVINVLCERKGIKARYCRLSDIKRQFSSNGQVTKASIVSYLVHKYPELTTEYRREERNQSKYYIRVFEALAVSLCTEGEQ
ncbi:MAG: hypothetical protein BGO69_17120 [Bacteroidetes bacterium 46-16]|nr:MAG: hypothetical protein BGO69_17120 [Bacteroidetes bacterium 46-16]